MLKGYRTYVVAAIVAAIGFLAEMSPERWQKLLDDPAGGIGLIVSGMLMAIMRSITTTAPGKPSSDADTE